MEEAAVNQQTDMPYPAPRDREHDRIDESTQAAASSNDHSEARIVEVPLSQPCFEHFFRPCFRGHDEAGLLAFEALQGSPRPARGQASDAKRNGTRTKRGSRGLESI